MLGQEQGAGGRDFSLCYCHGGAVVLLWGHSLHLAHCLWTLCRELVAGLLSVGVCITENQMMLQVTENPSNSGLRKKKDSQKSKSR